MDKLPLSYVKPDGGLYVFPKAKLDSFNSTDFTNKLLEEEKVAIIPGEAFGDYPEYFRIFLGTGKSEIRNSIRRMGEAINKWQPKL